MAPDYPKWKPATGSFVVVRRKEQTDIILSPSSEREGDDKASQRGITSKTTTILSTRYGHNPPPDIMVEISGSNIATEEEGRVGTSKDNVSALWQL